MIRNNIKNSIIKKIFKKVKKTNHKKFKYELLSDGYRPSDLEKAIKVLISGQITMDKITRNFEKYFSKKIGAKYALMVNSGSSANLLAFFCLTNPKRKKRLKTGDECLVPALCWSTSLWPIIQSGLKPVLVDVDENNFSISYENFKKNITKKTRAIMLINVLGNCSEIDKIRSLATKKNIYLIEDNCESLGSIYKNKYLGTYGEFGTFSFYFSHQITSGEGGMIVCKSKEDYNILKSLRSHGWDRELFKKKKKDFNFINQGFNLRPLETSAAIGLNQFKSLDKFKKIRIKNRNMIIHFLKKSKKWNNQFSFYEPIKHLKPSWFGLPLMINSKLHKNKKKFIDFLNKNKVETRQIISGNFANQPAIKLFRIKYNLKDLKSAQKIEDRGFFIGLPTKILHQKKIIKLTDLLLQISNF